MEKKRIYEIAREEGLPSSLVLQRLQRVGVSVKTASSTVEVPWAMHALNPNRYPKPDTPPQVETPAPRKKAEPEPEPEPEPETPPAPARPRPTRPRGTQPRRPQPALTPAPEAPIPVAAEPPAPAAPEAPPAAAPEAPAPAPAEPAPAVARAAEPPAEAPPAPPEPAAPVPEPTLAPEPEPETAPEPEPVRAPAAEPAAPSAAAEPVDTATPEAEEAPSAPEPAEAPAAAVPEQPAAEAPAAPEAAPAPPEPARPKPPISRGTPDPTNGAQAARGREAAGRPTRPVPAGAGGAGGGRGRRRRVVIDSQASRRGGPQQGRDRRTGRPPRREEKDVAPPTPAAELPPVEIASGATVKDVAEALDTSTAEVIKLLMQLGEMATITQSLSDEAIELVAGELERRVEIVRAEEEAEREEEFDDAAEDLVARAPVVTVMGHVDHGKTSLLDAIRQTRVAAGEAGGITQHIGAYQVHHGARDITFLDTPGHEAFTAMRARGAKVTDVAVIVVAADDGVMPQTVEAIDHARAAEVPFMVAVNKIDKEGANPDRVKQELTRQDVIPSDWGGSHEFVEVSALEGTGIDTLLETVLLVADADAEPRANPRPSASGTVIESRLDPGRGAVTSVLIQRGTLRLGDVVHAGDSFGRVRAMNDHTGAPLTEAGPSVPVEMLGLNGVPDAGERFRVVDSERTARQLAGERSQRLRAEELANRRPVSLDDLFARIREGGLKELNLIVKGDVQGSVGALVDAFERVEQTEVRLRVIHTGVGAITESDVMLASASEAIIIGFNIRPRPEASALAEREGVDIRTYRVIYRAIEDVRDALVGMLEPDIVEDIIGQAEVRATFRASRVGTIAGCYVTDGVIRRNAHVRLLREGTVVHEGRIASLRRFNDDVREVSQGFECGVLIEDYNDVKDGDTIEVYELREVARTAQAPSAPEGGGAEAGRMSEAPAGVE